MANDIQNKSASIYIDDAAARDAYDRLSKKADDYNQKLAEGTRKAEILQKQIQKALDAGAKPDAAINKLQKLNATIDKQKDGLEKVTAQQKLLQAQMDSKSGPSLKQQQALVTKLTNEYSHLGYNTEEAARKLLELGAASKVLDTMKDRLNSVRKVQDDAAKSPSFIGSFFGNLAANVVTRVGSAVSGFFSEAQQEALEADKATRRFYNTLSNLGRSDSFDRLSNKAAEVAEKFKYLDNDEVTGVFEKLIDYGHLTERQINQLIPVIVDFAAKEQVSITDASGVIVDALAGKGKALKKYGIDISEAQTETERLNVVLTTLKEKVDGSAQAFQDGAEGGIAMARQELANMKEELGNELIPVMSTFYSWTGKIAKGLGFLGTRAKEAVVDLVHLFDPRYFEGKAIDKQKDIDQKTISEYISAFATADKKALDAEISRQSSLLEAQRRTYAAQKNLVKEGAANKGDLLQTESALRVISGELEGLLSLKKNFDKDFGGGFGDFDKHTKDKKEKKDTTLDDQKKLLEELAKLRSEYLLKNATEQEKELEQAYQKYDGLKKLAHGNAELLKQIEENYQKAVVEIQHKYALKYQQDFEKSQADRQKRIDDLAKGALAAARQNLSGLEGQFKKADQDKLDKLKLDAERAFGKKKLQASKTLLNEQERQAIQAVIGQKDKEALIHLEYDKKRKEADEAYYKNLLDKITAFATAALTVLQGISNISQLNNQKDTNQENAELQRIEKKNDKEKAGYQALLNKKLISQQEYNKKVKELDDAYRAKESAAKRNQWERQQKADIISAKISGAQAILSALQTKPFLLGLGLAIIAGIQTGKQIDVIKSQPVPEFGKGGHLSGPSHSNGGMPVINPRTGRKEAEVEGGEVILSKKTVTNNKDIVSELLDASMNRNGARIQPLFRTRVLKTLDIDGLNKTIQKTRHYANGGTFQERGRGAGESAGQTVVVSALSPDQEALLKALYARLNEPIMANVVYGEYEAKASKVEQLDNDSVFKKG